MENKLDKDYKKLVENILISGEKRKDRTGTGTLSLFGKRIEHDASISFPAITTKKLAFKQVIVELLWFLKGDTNIKYLIENNCNIWNGDAYKAYQRACMYLLELDDLTQKEFIELIKTDDEFASQWGQLGPIYGKQWRKWKIADGSFTRYVDQIQSLIDELKENPNSRRLMVSAWNVSELEQMKLPPCHYGFQCYVREGQYIDLMWNQRSVDTFLGLPFNIASYTVLLHILAIATDLKVGKVIGSLGDTHLYINHVSQAVTLLERDPYELPELIISPTFKDTLRQKGLQAALDIAEPGMFKLLNYKSHPVIKAPLSN